MKKLFVLGLALASALALSACSGEIGIGYGGDGHWHHRPPPPPRPRPWDANQDQNQNQDTVQVQAQHLAADSQIKYSSAVTIVSVVESPNPQQALQTMNLDAQDLAALGNMQMPSDASIHQVALKLGESDAAISQIMHNFINDMQTDAGVR